MYQTPLGLYDIAKKFEHKLKKIKVVAADVDGVLTDGRLLWMGEDIGFNRFFNVSDGYGLKVLREAGLKVGVISGGKSLGLLKRVENLELDFAHLGNEDKRQGFLKVIEDFQCQEDEVCYIGDEFFDVPLLKRAGFSVTVPHADPEIKDLVDYITVKEGGHGCVREVCDIIRLAQGFVPLVPDFDDD